MQALGLRLTCWLATALALAACGGEARRALRSEPGAAGADAGDTSRAGGSSVSDGPELTCLSSPSSSPGACSLHLRCSHGVQVWSTCEEGDGQWSCQCDGSSRPAIYAVNDLTDDAACEAVARHCAQDSQPTAPQDCVGSADDERSAESCRVTRECNQPVQLGDRAAATLTTYELVSCANAGPGVMDCTCQDDRHVQVNGQDGTKACDTALGLCDPRSTVRLDVEPTCVPRSATSLGGTCRLMNACQRDVEVSDGVTATETKLNELECLETVDGGASHCSCKTTRGEVSFDAEGLGDCLPYAPLCHDASQFQLVGDVTCQMGSLGIDDDSCSVGITCRQRAQANGAEYVVYGTQDAHCSLVEGQYACTCVSYAGGARIEGAATTAGEACAAAVVRCPEALPVTIGDGALSLE